MDVAPHASTGVAAVRARATGTAAPIVAATAVAITWLSATTRGSVPISGPGDESGRLVVSYTLATPSRLFGYVTSWGSWTQIHPPVDIALRSALNGLIGTFVDDPGALIRANQLFSTTILVGGLAAAAVALWTVGPLASVVFVAFVMASEDVIYVAHHALAENLAIALVGVGTALLFRDRFVSAGVVVGIAGLVRPEIALVFATLAAVPAAARRVRAAVVFGMLAAAPAALHTVAVEVAGHSSYSSVRLWESRSFLGVAFSGLGPKVYWGLGVWPWIGLVAAVLVIIAGIWTGVPLLSPGHLLIAGWIVWSLVYAYFAAQGAIPTQVRTNVALHVLGGLALGVSALEVTRGRPRLVLVLSAVATAALIAVVPASARAREQWRAAHPADLVAVQQFLDDAGETDAFLADWLWWHEWTAALYSIGPGGDFCSYSSCTAGSEGWPTGGQTEGLNIAQASRIVNAWRFIEATSPRFIARLDGAAYLELRAYVDGRFRDTMSSFVRPLLVPDGECFRTVDGLPPARYCPATEVGRFVVLERVET